MLKWLVGGVLAVIGLIALVVAGVYLAFNRPDIPYETLEASYGGPASRFADLPGGVRMHYRDQGDPNAPALVLVHGFSASLHTWEPWVSELSAGDSRLATYRVVSIDLPGHGLTRAPAGYQASIEAYRDILHDFTSQLGLTRFALAGNSMGGNVAWEYALQYPDRVQALILVASSGWEETRQGLAEDPPVFRLLRNPVLGPILRNLDSTALTRQGLQASFYNPALATEDMVTRYVSLSRAPGHRDILLQMTLGFRERNYATPERLAPLANVPVLVMAGDTDRLVPPQHAEQFHNAISGSQLIVFENTGHIPQEERAAESAAAVDQFLAALTQGPALATAAR
ncbi:MAG: alpha/beta hydrolase [Hyphomonadaceae bacterium]|nr:alpha/beta hydrolase [Hyphomonadaceae bacterium]